MALKPFYLQRTKYSHVHLYVCSKLVICSVYKISFFCAIKISTYTICVFIVFFLVFENSTCVQEPALNIIIIITVLIKYYNYKNLILTIHLYVCLTNQHYLCIKQIINKLLRKHGNWRTHEELDIM